MSYNYHTRNVLTELYNLKGLAQKFLSERGPGRPPDLGYIKRFADYINAGDEMTGCLLFAAGEIARDLALTALYFALTDINVLFEQSDASAGVMQVLALFAAADIVIKKHRARGVPEKIIRDTFGDLKVWIENYSAENDGAIGVNIYRIWMHHHYTENLFRVGRLQYLLNPYRGYARLFIDDATGEMIMTAQAGIAFRGDGLVDGQNDIFSPETRWESESREDENEVRTNCLFVNGRAIRTPVLIDKKKYRIALEKGIYGLEMHIPRGEGLTHENCVESLFGARDFFMKLRPEQPFETYYCGSWLLDRNVQDFLPPSSGIVQFQKLYRLYPIPGNEWSFLDRGFGVRDPDETLKDLIMFARKADRSTALRRGVADYILAGGRLHSGAGIIHLNDVLRM